MAQADNTEALTNGEKIKGAVSALAVLGVVSGALAILVPNFFTNINSLITHHPYIAFSAWDLPFLVGVPMFGCLLYGIVLRLTNKATEQRIKLVVKLAIIFAVAAAVTRIVYGFAGNYYLKEQGYSHCWVLSSPSLMSPSIWVKNTDYCYAEAAPVRKPLLKWMDQQAAAGETITPDQLQQKASLLLSESY